LDLTEEERVLPLDTWRVVQCRLGLAINLDVERWVIELNLKKQEGLFVFITCTGLLLRGKPCCSNHCKPWRRYSAMRKGRNLQEGIFSYHLVV
jgi:hypothetical protein